MKFLPEFFKTENGIDKFAKMLRTFVDLEIPHIQFNVVRKEDLLAAKKNPSSTETLQSVLQDILHTLWNWRENFRMKLLPEQVMTIFKFKKVMM